MRRNVVATLALTSLFLFALLMSGCGDFFVSPGSIDQVTVTPSRSLLKSGDTLALTANAIKVDGTSSSITTTAIWTTSSSSVAAVDANGSVTAGDSEGSATITATAPKSKISGTAITRVTTGALPTQISVQAVSTSIALNGTVKFQATATLDGVTGQDISGIVVWSVTGSTTTAARVDSSGNVTGLAACSALIGTTCPSIQAALTTTSNTITASLPISSIQ